MVRTQNNVGIDIGSNSVKIVITEHSGSVKRPRILHTIDSPSQGIRQGYIVDLDQATQSLKRAISRAEAQYQQKITNALFSIGGAGLRSHYVRTSIAVDEKTGEINEDLISDIVVKAERLFTHKYQNKKILHIIPISYRVDGSNVLGTPIGMYGSELEIKVVFITLPEHHYESLARIIRETGIRVDDIVASPIADAHSCLNYHQKTHGCALLNIGAETSSVITFENNMVTSAIIFPLGSRDVTNDIALGLKISLEQAEHMKIGRHGETPKRKVDEITHARFADIFDLTENHLTKVKSKKFPAGIILTGGGSLYHNLEPYARAYMELPIELVKVSSINPNTKRKSSLSPLYSTSYGLCLEHGTQNQTNNRDFFKPKKLKKNLKNFFKQIMP
jgi:cell division protein FtsA